MRVMSTNPSFLQSSVDGQVKNLRDWGIPLGPPVPRAEALVRDPRAGRRRSADAACGATWPTPPWLAEQVAAAPGWRVLAPVQPADGLRPPRAAAASTARRWTRHTTAWVEAVNRSGAAYLTPAILDGRWMVRVSVGALTTEAADVDALWAAMRAAADPAR